MDRTKRFVSSTMLALLAVLSVFSPNVPAGQLRIVGTVNGTYQIITDEVEVYELAVTETGGRLGQLVGTRVTATGMVYEIAGAKVFVVIEYQVVERYTGETRNREVKGNE